MKTSLLALVALIVAGSATLATAQTLRWTFQIPAPGFAAGHRVSASGVSSENGGSVWRFGYASNLDIDDPTYRYQGESFVWLSNRGKLLLALDFPIEAPTGGSVFRLTRSSLYVLLTTKAGSDDPKPGRPLSAVIRRYRVVRGVIQTTETPVPLVNRPSEGGSVKEVSLPMGTDSPFDALGFFTIGSDVSGDVSEIRRYSN